jgi:hypothetical protein
MRKRLLKLVINPRRALSRLAARIGLPDADARRFIAHNRRMWRGWVPRVSDSSILVDLFGAGETNLVNSYFVNVLARRQGAVIRSFGTRRRISNRPLHEVYRSFNTAGHIDMSLNREQEVRRRVLSEHALTTMQTKQDVFDLEVLGVRVGVDIYETYLARYREPTVRLDDPRLREMVQEGIGLVIFWKDFLSTHRVSAVVPSHDCYLHCNVLCRIAYQAKVPVYLVYINRMTYAQRAYSVSAHFADYPEMFNRLSPEERRRGIEWARERLRRRFSGELNVDMPYAIGSAFRSSSTETRIVRDSAKLKVLVCAPCFTDNPHGCGGFPFVDFYEWLRFLAKIAERTDYDWYVKTHPVPFPVTLDTIATLCREFPRITVVPPETSHHQLAREGIDFVLTTYGTVGHEYPALGVPVINAGYNPRIAYRFNWTPKSIEEYEWYLLNLERLPKQIDLDDLYAFYYLHHEYTVADDLVLKSYRQASRDLTAAQRIGTGIFRYFLEQFTEAQHRETIEKMDAFISSGKANYFSRGPE